MANASKSAFARLLVALVVLMLGGTACTTDKVEIENTQPAQELKRLSSPPGSVYLGWRVFQDRCAGCHGSAGAGTDRAPDLLPIVRSMGARQFTAVVLNRYEWGFVRPAGKEAGAAHDALVEGVLQLKEPPLVMPEWQGEPRVGAHILDLFAYLSARAAGTQGPDRPAP